MTQQRNPSTRRERDSHLGELRQTLVLIAVLLATYLLLARWTETLAFVRTAARMVMA